jgi:hypothetical protein
LCNHHQSRYHALVPLEQLQQSALSALPRFHRTHSLQVKPWRTESDSSSQTGDRLIIHGEDLGSNRVLSWWDLLWQLNLLRDGGPALLDRALEIDVLDLLAQVCLGRENLNRAVLDLQKNICALFDFLLECA